MASIASLTCSCGSELGRSVQRAMQMPQCSSARGVTLSVQKQVRAPVRVYNHVLPDVSPFGTSTSAHDSFRFL